MKKTVIAFTLGAVLAVPLAAFAARDSVDLMVQQRQIAKIQKERQARQACIDLHQKLMPGNASSVQ